MAGAPIKSIVLAVNANRTIPDYLETGEYRPRPSVETLANAMDVGAPSNMERLFAMFPSIEDFRKNVQSYSVSDDEILRTIGEEFRERGHVICPHTACGERVRRDHYADDDTVVVATAHPAKFDKIVEPIIGKEIPVPSALFDILQKPNRAKSIGTDYHALF